MAIQAQPYQENLGLPLFGSQDYVDNYTCGYNQNQFFNGLQQKLIQSDQQQQQLQEQQHLLYIQQLQNLQQKSQTAIFYNKSCGDYKSDVLATNLQGTNLQLNQEGLEIDPYLKQQSERLRWALEEQRKQQLRSFLKTLETKAQVLLRQKDEQIAKATNTTMELQNFVRKLEVERQLWQRLAQQNEALVMSLANTIERLKDQACCNNARNNEEDDAESCCDNFRGQEGGGEAKDQYLSICKSCNSRPSCMLYLPCRHLCSCKECEMFLECCPVCSAMKKDSIEVLLS